MLEPRSALVRGDLDGIPKWRSLPLKVAQCHFPRWSYAIWNWSLELDRNMGHLAFGSETRDVDKRRAAGEGATGSAVTRTLGAVVEVGT